MTTTLSSSSSRDLLKGSVDGTPPIASPHSFKLHHWPSPTWCDFCTKFIWGLGKQGYFCKTCKYCAHVKCVSLVPNNCTVEVKDPNSKKNITRQELGSMYDLANALKSGVEIKDRKVLLKTYNQTFLGQEAINWMLQNLPIRDREEAIGLGNKLLEKGYIKSVESKPFRDGDALFNFEDIEKAAKNDVVSESKEAEPASANLNDFEELHVIGKGGFGKVVKVMKKDTQKIYAMKIMHKTKISGQRQLQCLIAEKNIMLNDNPFLVHLHYSFQTEEKLYFVMDYISGGDMAYHLEQKGRFSEKEARFILAEIVLALEHLHSCGIVYRDLKLENILLDKEGHICLTDFGLSKELESISGTTKTVCGTPTYLAPEVLLGQPYGSAIDWWSLGVVAFELFTGTNPFDAKDFDSVLSNILHSPINVPDYVSESGRDLIEKLLQRSPAKRLCSGATGSDEIQSHDFFKSIEWKKMMVKNVKAPYKPKAEENVDPKLQSVSEPIGNRKLDGKLDLENFNYSSKSVTDKAV